VYQRTFETTPRGNFLRFNDEVPPNRHSRVHITSRVTTDGLARRHHTLSPLWPSCRTLKFSQSLGCIRRSKKPRLPRNGTPVVVKRSSHAGGAHRLSTQAHWTGEPGQPANYLWTSKQLLTASVNALTNSTHPLSITRLATRQSRLQRAL
jgi:hypothetical protein